MSTITQAADVLDRCAAVYERLAAMHKNEADRVVETRSMMTGGVCSSPDPEPMRTMMAEAALCRQSSRDLRRIDNGLARLQSETTQRRAV